LAVITNGTSRSLDLPSHSSQPSQLCRLTGTVIAGVARLVSGYTVRWIECQPDTCQRVYFANHTSHLDAVVLWSALPREIRTLTRPVAALDYWGASKFHRFLAKSFNALLIDRKEIKVHQSPVELMIREIGDLHSLIVFPDPSMEKCPSSKAACITSRRNARI
jgi:hypothetical protein